MKCVVSTSVLPSCVRRQPLPDQVPGLRVETGCGFVHEDQLRIVDEGARERQAALHAARERHDLGVLAPDEASEIQKLRDAARDVLRCDAEIASIDDQVFLDAEVGIEIVELRHHADAPARLARAPGHRYAEEFDRAGVGLDQPKTELQGRSLAGAVRAEQAEAFAGRHLQVHAADHCGRAVGFAQPAHRERAHFQLAWTMRFRMCSLRWKKCSAPGTTTTGRSCGRAHPAPRQAAPYRRSRRG